MKTLKKILRLLLITCFIAMASFGIGLQGVIFPSYRDRYLNQEIKIEVVDKKEDDEESDQQQE
ncbi:MAG: hypothetical protein ACOYXT_25445 [Bacteroidota bacterium]